MKLRQRYKKIIDLESEWAFPFLIIAMLIILGLIQIIFGSK
jgi:hypothetical protein